ncbi:YbaB/EbfC family nucleoid-associated protein [Pirellulaceae bacterium SH449]
MFKNITQFASAMKNLSQLGPQVQVMQEKLEVARVYGSSYDILGTVHVEMSGLGVVVNTSISTTLLESGHQELTQRLVTEAMNEANRKAKELHVSAIRDLTGGAELIPGFNDMLKNITG